MLSVPTSDPYGGPGGGSDNNYGASGGGYQSRRPNPYAQQDDNPNRYEMTSVNTSNNYSSANSGSGAAGGGLDMNGFWNEVRFNLFFQESTPLKLEFVSWIWI